VERDPSAESPPRRLPRTPRPDHRSRLTSPILFRGEKPHNPRDTSAQASAPADTRSVTAGQPRGPSRKVALQKWSPKSLNTQLREPPQAFGVPHKNPTSPPPRPPPQDPHGHDDTPRHTPALMLKLIRKPHLNRRNAGAAGCQPGRSVVVRDRIELSTFRFSGMRITAGKSMYRMPACHLRAPSVLDHDGLGKPCRVAMRGEV